MKYCLTLILAFIVGCQTAKVQKESTNFRSIVAMETVDNYTVMYATKNNDTIAAVAKTGLLPDKAFDENYSLYVNFEGLSQIDSIITYKETVFFMYYIPTVSCAADKVGVIRHQPGPGCPRYVSTYSSLPYFVKSRKSFLVEAKD